MHGLKRYNLGRGDVSVGKQLFEVLGVIVTIQVLRNATVEYSVNH